MLLAICLFATSTQATQISVDPSYTDVSTGENFTVDIVIDPEENLVYAASYWLYFDNTVLNATLQTPGGFLKQDGLENTYITKEINNSIGRIKYSETRLGVDYGVLNPGILATITFQVIIEEEGISELQFDQEMAKMSDNLTNRIPTSVNNGTVNVRIGMCGDVNDDGEVDMGDVNTLWYAIANYPHEGAYELSC